MSFSRKRKGTPTGSPWIFTTFPRRTLRIMENVKLLWHFSGVLLKLNCLPQFNTCGLEYFWGWDIHRFSGQHVPTPPVCSVLLFCNVAYIFTFLRKILLVWKSQLSGFYILQGAE